MEAFPRNRLAILSIRQAKGLEFRLVIVDIGSDFARNHPAQAFKRFPNDLSSAQRLEDLGAPYRPLNFADRSGIDRAFDDLYRMYFVAFSRAEQVLILVGHSQAAPAGSVPNVASVWRRDFSAAWAQHPPYLAL